MRLRVLLPDDQPTRLKLPGSSMLGQNRLCQPRTIRLRAAPLAEIITALRHECVPIGLSFSLDHDLPRTAACFQCPRLVLSFGQCSRSWWYVIPQGLRMLRQVDQRRNQVPALQLIRVLHHADAVVPIAPDIAVAKPGLDLLIDRRMT